MRRSKTRVPFCFCQPRLVLSTLGLCLLVVGCTSQAIEYEMTWRYGEPANKWPETRHVLLSFVDYPNHRVGIYSKDLGQYLEHLNTETVAVTFEVSTRFGCFSGYSVVKIGELQHWNSEFSYGGLQGEYHPAPWDKWECWFNRD